MTVGITRLTAMASNANIVTSASSPTRTARPPGANTPARAVCSPTVMTSCNTLNDGRGHMDHGRDLTPGRLSARSGVSVSALHFYEREGLLTSRRTAGNQRRYDVSTLRRVAFIRTSQQVGIPLADIRTALDDLPAGRAPTPADWARLSRRWRADLDRRITRLQQLRDTLDDCIGCGCLSLDACALANPDDTLGVDGSGARLWSADGTAS